MLLKTHYNASTLKELNIFSFCNKLIDLTIKNNSILATDVQILKFSLKKNNIFGNFFNGHGQSIAGGKTPATLGLPMKKGILKNIFSDYISRYITYIHEVFNTNRKLNYKDLKQNLIKPLNERNSLAVRPFKFNKKLFSIKMNVNKKLQGKVVEVVNNTLKIIDVTKKKTKKNIENTSHSLEKLGTFSLENCYYFSFNGCRLGKLRRRWKRKSKKIKLKGRFHFNLKKK